MQNQSTYDIPTHDVIIISPGGVASSYLIDYLTSSANLKCNCHNDTDGLKHASFKKIDKINETKCHKMIYLFNDPMLAIDSLYRRSWHVNNMCKLDDPYKIAHQSRDKAVFIKKVVEQNKDLFGIETQFDFFLKDPTLNKTVLFIDFDDIISQKQTIANFLNINPDLLNNLRIHNRHSFCDPTYPPEYTRIYSKLYAKMKAYNGLTNSCEHTNSGVHTNSRDNNTTPDIHP